MKKNFILFFKRLFQAHPTEGDKVKVAVGFSSYLNEGVVSRVVITKDDAYCWIDQLRADGSVYHSFTASFSYCFFHYV